MKRIIILCILLFCTGCSVKLTEDDLSKMHFVKADLEMGDKTPEERAAAIKRRLKQIDGVAGTGVVVEGHTAIIGLRLKENMTQTETFRIKQEADAAARAADEYTEHTSITTNTYIVSLIEESERNKAA